MLSAAETFAIGIDIGGTKIASVLLEQRGGLVASRQVPTRAQEGMQAVFDRVAEQIQNLASQAPGRIAGVGIGSPGKVDSECGIVYDAVNLGWTEAHLVEEITRRIGSSLPVWIQKDTNLNALGEYYFGASTDCDDFIYIGVGSGLGAGIISSGRLITGADWYAADVGHLSLDPNGPVCACGGHGCAELTASGPGLVRVTRALLANSSAPGSLSSRLELTPEDVLEAAARGDSLALTALAEVGRVLGIIMSACTVILNPGRFVIGGGLGLAGFDFIVPSVRGELMQRTLPNHRGSMDIVRSQVETPAVGSACVVWYELSRKKLEP